MKNHNIIQLAKEILQKAPQSRTNSEIDKIT